MSERKTDEWYSTFANVEAKDQSAIYYDWATGVAGDPEVQAVIDLMPLQKRQPNLVFACSRLLGAPEGTYAEFRDWYLAHSDAVAAETVHRMTQTNEPRRCASLLPALGLIDGPLALLEVGASAGLCLYPDQYSYLYTDHTKLGDSTVLLECETTGAVPVPGRLPTIAWRAGIDLHPLDVLDAEDMRWLETLVWPEQEERRMRLRAAIEIARQDPPRIIAGDGRLQLAELAAEAPVDATLIVISSGTLVYLPAAERSLFAQAVHELDARWVSLEGRGALPAIEASLPPGGAGRFVLALDEAPLAYTGPHGQSLDWL